MARGWILILKQVQNDKEDNFRVTLNLPTEVHFHTVREPRRTRLSVLSVLLLITAY
mgnify:CR=1 FL=1